MFIVKATSSCKNIYCKYKLRFGLVAGLFCAPILGRHGSESATKLGYVHYYVRLHVLLYQVVCAAIVGCMCNVYAKLVLVIVFCNLLKEVMLDYLRG